MRPSLKTLYKAVESANRISGSKFIVIGGLDSRNVRVVDVSRDIATALISPTQFSYFSRFKPYIETVHLPSDVLSSGYADSRYLALNIDII